MADTTTSRHESNYIKIAMVVLRVSPRAVRVQFDREFHPNCLQRTLKSELGCLSDLKTKKRITQPQWNLLFPRTGEQPSSKDFDITLMICLLRNLIPIDVMDKLPSATDTSLRADLSRIKFYRNIIVHCDSALVDDTEFESYWKDVTPAILRLGGNSLKEECDDWYGRNLDAEQRDDGLKCIKDEKRLALVEEELAEQSKELVETNKKLMELEQEQSNPVPKNIRDSFTEQIESWKKDKFFETSVVTTILEEVRNKSFVVITGSSGMGKSTIVKLVALQLQKTKDYHILPVMCPKDIVKYFDPNIKQIYIIDDICGKFSVDQSMINSWERVKCQILKWCKDNKEFRILGTCRLEISISSPFRKLQEKYEITECNLLQKKFLYSKEEKLKIAACHIDEETIKQLDDKILNAYNMFPLLCMMYAAASESNPGVRFFEYPLQAIEEQLDEMKEQNECHFIGLALIVIYNNKLHKLLLQNRNDQKFEDVYNDVFEDLGLVNRPSKRSVLSGLQGLEGIYTKELESTITVIHDKIFDIFALYFGKRIPKTILTHGSGTFIAERFLFESIEEDCNDLKIVLPSELEHSYFNRMVEEIENNRFYNVFENVQVHNELYQGKFISFLSKHAHQCIIQKLLYDKWPLYLSAVNGCKLLVQFILNEKTTSGICKDGNHPDMLMDEPESGMYACGYDSDTDSESESRRNFNKLWDYYYTDSAERTTEEDAYRIRFENSPMVAACEGGYIDIVECLEVNGYNIINSDGGLPHPLFSACKYGKTDVVDFILERYDLVDIMDEPNITALHVACENGNTDIVTSLLEYNCNMDIEDINGFTPLCVACKYGHTDVVQILLDNNCDIEGAIHVACEKGYKDIVEILIKHNVDINLRGELDIQCATPIEFACSNGHTDVVKLLLDNNCDVFDNHGFSSALHYACRKGFVDIVALLLRNNCNINQCNSFESKSPLIVACGGNGEAVVKLLLSYEACDVNIIDEDGSNALHYACREGQSDVVELLLKHYCNVNLNDKWMKTPLFIACEEGHVDIVKILINRDNYMIDVLDVEGNGLLHATCGKFCRHKYYIIPSMLSSTKNGRIEIIGILLGKGCDVNVLNNEGQSVLHAACVYGDTEIVDILLRSNSNVNQCDKAKKTPLFIACKYGHIDIVDILLRSNSNVNQCDKAKKTPLFIACKYGHIDIVDILLRSNSNVNQCDEAKKTPLFIACEEGYIDIVRLLIESKCEILIGNEIFNHSLNGTALHAACRGSDKSNKNYLVFETFTECHKDILTLLIDKKYDVNISDDNSQTPLHIACYKGNVALVEILLRNKCVVDQCDNLNKTPFFLACEEGHKDVVKSLMNYNCNMDIRDKIGRSALQAVCTTPSNFFCDNEIVCDRVDIAELLINKKCFVYDLDDAGQSALHAACKQSNSGIVKLLLENKLDVDQHDKMGETPIFNACRKYLSDALKLLIEWNCDVNVLNINGLNALNIAFNYENFRLMGDPFELGDRLKTRFKEVVKLLVDSGCSVNICDADGQTPLHRACSEGYVDEAELFLKKNSNINQCDKLMKTPLILAVEGGHTQVVKLLVDSDCSVNICDADEQTPLHRACSEGYVDEAELFLKRNSNINQCDKMGETPIFNACRKYRSDALKLLIEWNCDVNVLNINGLNALNIVFNSEVLKQTWHKMFPFMLKTQFFEEVVKLLVDSGCSVNICDADGQTPLHRACSEGYVDEAELFLKKNSNINQCDKLMKTPLILAVEGRHTKVVAMLVENKCNIDISDKDGRTALDIAVEKQVVDITNILLNAMKKDTNAHDACIKKAKYF